jgi:outer membrane lipoprotein-sorting protein
VNYDSLFAIALPLDKSQEGQRVVEECMEAYGGAEKLAALTDFELTYEATSRFNSGSYKVVKSFRRGRQYKIERLNETRILNGEKCWVQNEDGVERDQSRYRNELYSYLTLAMPLAIQTERFDNVRFGKRSGDPLAYIYLEKQDSLMTVLGINQDSGLIQSIVGVVRYAENSFVFVNHFDGYQEHDDYLFPGEITTISLGLEVSRSKLDAVKVNPGFAEKTFKP